MRIVKGHKDVIVDPIGSVSFCCKAHTKLNLEKQTTVCAKCGQTCDMYVPTTQEEFEAPEIKENGQGYWKFERDGLEKVNEFNKLMA